MSHIRGDTQTCDTQGLTWSLVASHIETSHSLKACPLHPHLGAREGTEAPVGTTNCLSPFLGVEAWWVGLRGRLPDLFPQRSWTSHSLHYPKRSLLKNAKAGFPGLRTSSAAPAAPGARERGASHLPRLSKFSYTPPEVSGVLRVEKEFHLFTHPRPGHAPAASQLLAGTPPAPHPTPGSQPGSAPRRPDSRCGYSGRRRSRAMTEVGGHRAHVLIVALLGRLALGGGDAGHHGDARAGPALARLRPHLLAQAQLLSLDVLLQRQIHELVLRFGLHHPRALPSHQLNRLGNVDVAVQPWG